LPARMGGVSSTPGGRNLTVVNDEAEGAIKISDSVIDRLRAEIVNQQLAKQQQDAAAEPPPSAVEPSPPPPAAAPVAPEPAEDSAPPPPPPPPPQRQEVPPPPPPMPEPEELPPIPPMMLTPPTAIPTFVEPPPPPPPPPQPAPPPPPPPAPVQQPTPPPPPPQPELKLQRPIIQYIEEPSLSSLRVRAEKEQELAEQERYWKQRLTDLDKEQSVLVNLQTASMSQTLKGMQDQVGSVHTRPPVCPDLKEKITACLGANKGTPLNCSPLVQEFSRCVDKSRLSFSGRAG